MKKLLSVLAIAAVMTACKDKAPETPAVDSTAKKVDTAKAVVDTAKKADTAKTVAVDTAKKAK